MAKVVILGGGVSGRMMAKRLEMMCPSIESVIIDKGADSADHVFHLHRTIPEIPELDNKEYLKEHKFQSSVLTADGLKASASLKDINDYSYKTFGRLNITNAGNSGNFTIIPIGKQRLIQSIGKVNIQIGEIAGINLTYKLIDYSNKSKTAAIPYDYIVSTIAMPKMLNLAKIETKIKFENFPFYGISKKLSYNTNTYQQLVITDPNIAMARVTLFDDELFIESVNTSLSELELAILADFWGQDIFPIDRYLKTIYPGRLNILTQAERKPLLYWLTQEHDIFTLGRYGAWTYKVANDVWDDTKFICEMIMAKEQGRNYKER
jgi:hypothetical protein